MTVPPGREHTAHLYYVRMPTEEVRDRFIAHMRSRGVSTPFHYVPLNFDPAGLKMGRAPDAVYAQRLVLAPICAAAGLAVDDERAGHARVGGGDGLLCVTQAPRASEVDTRNSCHNRDTEPYIGMPSGLILRR